MWRLLSQKSAIRSWQSLLYDTTIIRKPNTSRWVFSSTAAAMATLAGASYLLDEHQDEQNERKQKEKTTKIPTTTTINSTPFMFNRQQPTNNSTATTMCEAPLGLRFSRLRRHKTIQKMERTAERERLETKYKVNWKEPLGEGTFGQVFQGIDKRSGEKVAVKKISKAFTDNISFQREMDALMHIRQYNGHPHICGLRENFEEDGYYYLVLDLISGGEMFDALIENGAYSEADAARLIREVASALAFIHGIGIVHCDLKPENLMLSSCKSSDAAIQLVDFGTAQVSHEGEDFEDLPLVQQQQQSTLACTPAYSPPEIIKFRRARNKNKSTNNGRLPTIDPSFDMWALGVILFVMLAGVHPFDLGGCASDEEIEHSILTKKLPNLRKSPLTAHLSNDAISVIEKLLQWDPKKRYTAHELLNHPWVRGETARTSIIADSDKRLSKYRAFKSTLEAKVFADLVTLADVKHNDDDKRTSLIEHAFHNLDPTRKGYVSSSDLQKFSGRPSTETIEDEQLSLSGFSELLSENMKNRYFPKGHIIYTEGTVGHNMYFINSGVVEVYTKDGFTRVMRNPGEYFGEGALLSQDGIRTASIKCVTPVHAIEISRDFFDKYLKTDANLKVRMREKNKARRRQRARSMLRLQDHMEEKTARYGEYIFQEGAEGDELYILEEGQVETYVGGKCVFNVGPGEMFGEHSVIFGRPRNTSARCMSNICRYHVLQGKDFHRILEKHPLTKESIRDICYRREFQKAICALTKRAFPKTEYELKKAFQVVDINNSGVLELRNIRTAIQKLDPTFDEDDVREILKSLDLDESGEVSWTEFKRIFGMDDSN